MRQRWVVMGSDTYSRGFFLGPGFPRGLGRPSAVSAIIRFVPGAGPFRFLGGSVVELASGTGTGVELDSDAASADSVILSVGAPSVRGAGDVACGVFDDSSGFGCVFSSNFASSSGVSWRMTTLEGFLTLSDLLAEVDG